MCNNVISKQFQLASVSKKRVNVVNVLQYEKKSSSFVRMSKKFPIETGVRWVFSYVHV